jgi:hypothetical protein
VERVRASLCLFHLVNVKATACRISLQYLMCSFSVIDDKSPLPPPGATEEEDTLLLQDEPYIDGPIKVDYGSNLRYSPSLSGADMP